MRALKRAAAAALALPPAYPVLRARALRGGALTVLCYHTLGPDAPGPDAWTVLRAGDFRRQLRHLARRYEIVDLDAALAPAPPGGRPRAVLTFDDGEAGLHAHLLPILEETPVPVTVYVATAQIESGRPYWFDRVMNALQAPGPVAVDLRAAGLGRRVVGPARGAARWAAIGAILEALKTVDADTREALAAAVVAAAPEAPAPALRPMTREELARLAAHPAVTVGAHSHGHELLDRIPLAAATESAARSRALLRDWTGQAVRHFAYPNGNHTPALAAALRELGFASAAALDMGLARPGFDRFALPRIGIGRYDGPARFRLRLAGL